MYKIRDILCDSGRYFVAAIVGFFTPVYDISSPEGMDVLEGLKPVQDVGCSDIVIEVDCSVLVTAINERSVPLKYLGSVKWYS